MTMTVRELIEELKYQDPNAEVRFAYNYKDHWNTMVAAGINHVDEGETEYSDYHLMHKIVDEPYDEDTGKIKDDIAVTVILSAGGIY